MILIGVLSLSYIVIFLLSPKDIIDYTVVDTEYWRTTENRLLLKAAYDYNDKDSILSFPKTLGDWKSFDYTYPDWVYTKLNADILMSRGYTKDNRSIIWMDIINSKTGESFHKQKVCVEGAGWNIDDESVAEFNIKASNPFTKLRVNRLYISKGNKKQVMIYWFMFNKFGHDDSVVMIRLSSSVKNNDSEKTFNHMKSFVVEQLFGVMYEETREEVAVAEHLIEKYGNKGIIAIGIILLVSVGFTVKGIRKKD